MVPVAYPEISQSTVFQEKPALWILESKKCSLVAGQERGGKTMTNRPCITLPSTWPQLWSCQELFGEEILQIIRLLYKKALYPYRLLFSSCSLFCHTNGSISLSLRREALSVRGVREVVRAGAAAQDPHGDAHRHQGLPLPGVRELLRIRIHAHRPQV